MKTAKRTQGFTLIELLIVIAIIGILAAVLLPSLLGARTKANDAAAASVGRQVLNAMAAVEVSSNATALCSATSAAAPAASGVAVTPAGTPAVIYVSTKAADPNQATVNTPAPVTKVTCTNTTTQFQVDITYAGGSNATATYKAAK